MRAASNCIHGTPMGLGCDDCRRELLHARGPSVEQLTARVAELEAEVAAWRERFPLCAFTLGCIVMAG